MNDSINSGVVSTEIVSNEVAEQVAASEASGSLEQAVSSKLPLSDPSLAADAAVRNLHKVGYFQEYTSGIPLVDVTGFRAVTCQYKAQVDKVTKKVTKAAAHKNVYIYIPDTITPKNIEARLSELMPYMVSYFQEQERQLVRKAHMGKSVFLADNALGLNAVIEALEASGEGTRLNKVMLEAWFATNIQEKLESIFMERKGIDENSSEAELIQILNTVLSYKTSLCALASPKMHYNTKRVDTLVKCLTLTGMDSDAIGLRLVARLKGMGKEQEVELDAL